MRNSPLLSLLTIAILAGAIAGSEATAAGREPSCAELVRERAFLIGESRRLTAAVESKNVELGETAGELKAARQPSRKRELSRRAEGLRRELTVLLDRELESVNRLGHLDATISSKRCGKRGAK